MSANTIINGGAPASSRYARQKALDVIGQSGQEALAKSTIVIVGCGALGSIQAELLARAGVGRLILIDRDVLELHNLQRQLLFDEQDVREGLPKAAAAARHLRIINSEITIESVIADVTANNILDLLQPANLVIDGTDNLEIRYLLNDAAVQAEIPWIYGGVQGTDGTVMAIRPGVGPCFRCIFPDPPDARQLPTCETQGVLNTAVVWTAALQVTEAMRLLVHDPVTEFKLHALNIWRGSTTSIHVKRQDTCACCVHRRFEFLSGKRGSSSAVFCGRNAVQVTPESKTAIDFDRLRERLAPLGTVKANGLVLEFMCGNNRLVVFPDGRVLVMGTTDTTQARILVAKYLGS